MLNRRLSSGLLSTRTLKEMPETAQESSGGDTSSQPSPYECESAEWKCSNPRKPSFCLPQNGDLHAVRLSVESSVTEGMSITVRPHRSRTSAGSHCGERSKRVHSPRISTTITPQHKPDLTLHAHNPTTEPVTPPLSLHTGEGALVERIHHGNAETKEALHKDENPQPKAHTTNSCSGKRQRGSKALYKSSFQRSIKKHYTAGSGEEVFVVMSPPPHCSVVESLSHGLHNVTSTDGYSTTDNNPLRQPNTPRCTSTPSSPLVELLDKNTISSSDTVTGSKPSDAETALLDPSYASLELARTAAGSTSSAQSYTSSVVCFPAVSFVPRLDLPMPQAALNTGSLSNSHHSTPQQGLIPPPLPHPRARIPPLRRPSRQTPPPPDSIVSLVHSRHKSVTSTASAGPIFSGGVNPHRPELNCTAHLLDDNLSLDPQVLGFGTYSVTTGSPFEAVSSLDLEYSASNTGRLTPRVDVDSFYFATSHSGESTTESSTDAMFRLQRVLLQQQPSATHSAQTAAQRRSHVEAAIPEENIETLASAPLQPTSQWVPQNAVASPELTAEGKSNTDFPYTVPFKGEYWNYLLEDVPDLPVFVPLDSLPVSPMASRHRILPGCPTGPHPQRLEYNEKLLDQLEAAVRCDLASGLGLPVNAIRVKRPPEVHTGAPPFVFTSPFASPSSSVLTPQPQPQDAPASPPSHLSRHRRSLAHRRSVLQRQDSPAQLPSVFIGLTLGYQVCWPEEQERAMAALPPEQESTKAEAPPCLRITEESDRDERRKALERKRHQMVRHAQHENAFPNTWSWYFTSLFPQSLASSAEDGPSMTHSRSLRRTHSSPSIGREKGSSDLRRYKSKNYKRSREFRLEIPGAATATPQPPAWMVRQPWPTTTSMPPLGSPPPVQGLQERSSLVFSATNTEVLFTETDTLMSNNFHLTEAGSVQRRSSNRHGPDMSWWLRSSTGTDMNGALMCNTPPPAAAQGVLKCRNSVTTRILRRCGSHPALLHLEEEPHDDGSRSDPRTVGSDLRWSDLISGLLHLPTAGEDEEDPFADALSPPTWSYERPLHSVQFEGPYWPWLVEHYPHLLQQAFLTDVSRALQVLEKEIVIAEGSPYISSDMSVLLDPSNNHLEQKRGEQPADTTPEEKNGLPLPLFLHTESCTADNPIAVWDPSRIDDSERHTYMDPPSPTGLQAVERHLLKSTSYRLGEVAHPLSLRYFRSGTRSFTEREAGGPTETSPSAPSSSTTFLMPPSFPCCSPQEKNHRMARLSTSERMMAATRAGVLVMDYEVHAASLSQDSAAVMQRISQCEFSMMFRLYCSVKRKKKSPPRAVLTPGSATKSSYTPEGVKDERRTSEVQLHEAEETLAMPPRHCTPELQFIPAPRTPSPLSSSKKDSSHTRHPVGQPPVRNALPHTSSPGCSTSLFKAEPMSCKGQLRHTPPPTDLLLPPAPPFDSTPVTPARRGTVSAQSSLVAIPPHQRRSRTATSRHTASTVAPTQCSGGAEPLHSNDLPPPFSALCTAVESVDLMDSEKLPSPPQLQRCLSQSLSATWNGQRSSLHTSGPIGETSTGREHDRSSSLRFPPVSLVPCSNSTSMTSFSSAVAQPKVDHTTLEISSGAPRVQTANLPAPAGRPSTSTNSSTPQTAVLTVFPFLSSQPVSHFCRSTAQPSPSGLLARSTTDLLQSTHPASAASLASSTSFPIPESSLGPLQSSEPGAPAASYGLASTSATRHPLVRAELREHSPLSEDSTEQENHKALIYCGEPGSLSSEVGVSGSSFSQTYSGASFSRLQYLHLCGVTTPAVPPVHSQMRSSSCGAATTPTTSVHSGGGGLTDGVSPMLHPLPKPPALPIMPSALPSLGSVSVLPLPFTHSSQPVWAIATPSPTGEDVSAPANGSMAQLRPEVADGPLEDRPTTPHWRCIPHAPPPAQISQQCRPAALVVEDVQARESTEHVEPIPSDTLRLPEKHAPRLFSTASSPTDRRRCGSAGQMHPSSPETAERTRQYVQRFHTSAAHSTLSPLPSSAHQRVASRDAEDWMTGGMDEEWLDSIREDTATQQCFQARCAALSLASAPPLHPDLETAASCSDTVATVGCGSLAASRGGESEAFPTPKSSADTPRSESPFRVGTPTAPLSHRGFPPATESASPGRRSAGRVPHRHRDSVTRPHPQHHPPTQPSYFPLTAQPSVRVLSSRSFRSSSPLISLQLMESSRSSSAPRTSYALAPPPLANVSAVSSLREQCDAQQVLTALCAASPS